MGHVVEFPEGAGKTYNHDSYALGKAVSLTKSHSLEDHDWTGSP